MAASFSTRKSSSDAGHLLARSVRELLLMQAAASCSAVSTQLALLLAVCSPCSVAGVKQQPIHTLQWYCPAAAPCASQQSKPEAACTPGR